MASGYSIVPWIYEAEQNPKRKHAWSKDIAGFEEFRGLLAGKCPNNITKQEAEALINDGIAWSPPGWDERWPRKIFVVRQGVVYRAVPTVPGVSYHAFPEQGRALRELPQSVQTQILERAREQGCEPEVRKWMSS